MRTSAETHKESGMLQPYASREHQPREPVLPTASTRGPIYLDSLIGGEGGWPSIVEGDFL